MKNLELKKMANEVRKGIVTAVHSAKAGHPGGSLSAADLYTYLYFEEMNVGPDMIGNPDRDRFVLSKGHTCPGLYAAMALKGFFPVEELKTFRKLGTRLQGHPSMQYLPGLDMSSGSLGQGISAACGMALAGKVDKKDYRVYTLLGDGELEEGQVWEAAMFAGAKKLDNLCAIVDRNRLQISGSTEDVMKQDSQEERWAAFGWNVLSIPGNDVQAIDAALTLAAETKGKPTVIILNTVKGYGSPVMEDKAGWHHHLPNDEEYAQIIADFAAHKEAING